MWEPQPPQPGGVSFRYVNFPETRNANLNSTVVNHIHFTPQTTDFDTLQFRWYRNGAAWTDGGGTLPIADIIAPNFAGITLSLAGGLTHEQRGGDWTLRVTLVDADGIARFEDISRVSALTINTPPGQTSFTDTAGHWAADAIQFMSEQGLMRGTSATTFSPNATLTRAQAATILYRIAGEPAVTATQVFDDVAPGRWYSDAVVWAYQNGIVQGVGNDRFAPMSPITREQMATILYRFAAYQGQEMTVASGFALDFPDAIEVSSWAESAMRWAVSEGLFRGTNVGELVPRNTATRAQTAEVLTRFVNG